MNQNNKVAIIGGGIAGLTAANQLAGLGIKVDVIERNDFIGGQAINYTCKADDNCLQCGACAADKIIKEAATNDNITFHLSSEVKTVSEKDGFQIELQPAENGCVPTPQRVYPLKNEASGTSVATDAVILSYGFTPFDAAKKSTYGYGQWKNVVTGVELEKMIKENGCAFKTDGTKPKKMAFIQCVGSRDARLGNHWCSQVCCSYACRMALSLKKKLPETTITMFYMDIQNSNKDYQAFYDQSKEKLDFKRIIPVDVYPEEGDQLKVMYMSEAGELQMETVDMLVLSVGITPNTDAKELSGKFNVPTDESGFILSQNTSDQAKGVFYAGAAVGPKSISGSIAQAKQAASQTLKYLRGE